MTNQGTTFEQEITPISVDEILERILRQTQQHLNDDEGNIYDDEEEQLERLIEAIEAGEIDENNIEDYMQLWFPEVLSDDAGHKTVQLTVYDDGASRFRCFIPGGYFEIYEY